MTDTANKLIEIKVGILPWIERYRILDIKNTSQET